MRFRRRARWLVPVVAAAVVAAGGVVGVSLPAGAAPTLPAQSAQQLIASMARSKDLGFFGSITERASLGLPQLPQTGPDSSTGLLGLLTGSHTVRAWFDGPTRQRVAVLSQFGEQDLYRDQNIVWLWDSADRSATRVAVPAAAADAEPSTAAMQPTPSGVANAVLSALGPSTTVTVGDAASVAGRPSYALVLTPKTSTTLVGSVIVYVDAKHRVPLGVRVYARGASDPALSIVFTSISFTTPAASVFSFTPPAGATVRDGLDHPAARDQSVRAGGVQTFGSGWTTVVGLPAGTLSTEGAGGGNHSALSGPLLDALSPVHGTWGSGRLLTSALLSVLITDDGRVYVGAVGPEALYAAAGRR